MNGVSLENGFLQEGRRIQTHWYALQTPRSGRCLVQAHWQARKRKGTLRGRNEQGVGGRAWGAQEPLPLPPHPHPTPAICNLISFWGTNAVSNTNTPTPTPGVGGWGLRLSPTHPSATSSPPLPPFPSPHRPLAQQVLATSPPPPPPFLGLRFLTAPSRFLVSQIPPPARFTPFPSQPAPLTHLRRAAITFSHLPPFIALSLGPTPGKARLAGE